MNPSREDREPPINVAEEEVLMKAGDLPWKAEDIKTLAEALLYKIEHHVSRDEFLIGISRLKDKVGYLTRDAMKVIKVRHKNVCHTYCPRQIPPVSIFQVAAKLKITTEFGEKLLSTAA